MLQHVQYSICNMVEYGCFYLTIVTDFALFFCFFHDQSTFVIHRYYLYICESKGHVVLFTVLFGYKALLQITALVLALCTHKVKVKGLDDSKYITASIYVTSIVLVVTTVSYALIDYVNVYPAVVGLGLLVGTTVILGLVFVSRVSQNNICLSKFCVHTPYTC